jgi:ABC-type nitrate/sulfonate/bicarbonate transport system substrate-binding protein
MTQVTPPVVRSNARGSFRRASALAGIGVFLGVGLILGGCASESAGTREPATIVRFVFAPDPAWDYMNDTGIVAKWEDAYNMKMVNTTTPDEVAWFVGGHADIASLGTYETPIVAKNTGADFTIFGKYNATRNTFFVRADSPYHSIQDLKGKKIGVIGPGSSTLAWGAMFQDLYGLDYRIGGGDFELLVQEYAAMPPLLIKGELEAVDMEQDKAASYVVSGDLRLLDEQNYGTTWEFFRNNYDPEKQFQGLMSNDFVARTEWFDANPDAVQFFLKMWQEGVDAWQTDKADIIAQYPQHFAVSTPEDTQWLVDYINAGHDWFVKDVTLTDAWNALELKSLEIFRNTGRIDADIADPKMVVVPIKSN